MVFAFSFVFALFGVALTDGAKVMESLLSLVFRLWTMISSFTYGFAVGRIITTDKCNIIEYKIRVNELFANDKDFKGFSAEELARKEYEDYESKKVVVDLLTTPPNMIPHYIVEKEETNE